MKTIERSLKCEGCPTKDNCKLECMEGCTFTKDATGSAHDIVLNSNDVKIAAAKAKRPAEVAGKTMKIKTGCGSMFVTLNSVNDQPFEVFLNMGKAGGCAFSQCESIGRLISYSLRIGGDIAEIISQLKGVRCHQSTDEVSSCSDAVGKALETLLSADAS